jgi:hypothetical protein
MLAAIGLQPDGAAGRDHLGRQQAGAAELADHLAVGVVRVARHRRLQDRRIDDDRADGERSDGEGWRWLDHAEPGS